MIRPNTGWLNLITLCNNKCLGCYAEDSCTPNAIPVEDSMMPEQQALELLDSIKHAGCRTCILIGGEPTLHPGIIRIFGHGKKQLGLKMKLVSNGRRFSHGKFCDEMIAAGLETGEITLSMHAPSREESLALAGSAKAFDQFLTGLNNLCHRGVRPGINIVLFKHTEPYIEQMLQCMIENDISNVAFNLGAPSFGTGGGNAEFCLPPDTLAQRAYEIFEMGERMGIKTSFLFQVPFCLLEHEKMQRLIAAGAISSGCQIMSGSGILFNKNGDLVPCNHLLDQVTLPRADAERVMRENSFDSFWNSEHMTSLRTEACEYRADSCRECEWWNMCGGGCSLFWTCYNPSDYIRGRQMKGESNGCSSVL